jgi:hypothetical protein
MASNLIVFCSLQTTTQRPVVSMTDEEQRSISQICELFLKGAVEDYKKDGANRQRIAILRNKAKKVFEFSNWLC